MNDDDTFDSQEDAAVNLLLYTFSVVLCRLFRAHPYHPRRVLAEIRDEILREPPTAFSTTELERLMFLLDTLRDDIEANLDESE